MAQRRDIKVPLALGAFATTSFQMTGHATVGNPLLIASRNEGTYHYYSADYRALRALTDYLWRDCCRRGKEPAG